MNKIRIGLNGAGGKMCLSIQNLIENNQDFDLVAQINRQHTKSQIINDCNKCDTILDFSSADGLNSLLECLDDSAVKILVGTTGLHDGQLDQLKNISKNRAVLYAPNTSLGPNLVAQMAAKAAQILKSYDIEILESHHRYKKDAPSGTALMIGQEIAKAREIDFKEYAVFNRNNSMRQDNEIGFASIRAGGIYGEHEVIFANDYELVTIGTRALSRQSFAQGALFAAKWLNNQPPGFYSMKDVLSNMM